jgi:hypothetical protein
MTKFVFIYIGQIDNNTIYSILKQNYFFIRILFDPLSKIEPGEVVCVIKSGDVLLNTDVLQYMNLLYKQGYTSVFSSVYLKDGKGKIRNIQGVSKISSVYFRSFLGENDYHRYYSTRALAIVQ